MGCGVQDDSSPYELNDDGDTRPFNLESKGEGDNQKKEVKSNDVDVESCLSYQKMIQNTLRIERDKENCKEKFKKEKTKRIFFKKNKR